MHFWCVCPQLRLGILYKSWSCWEIQNTSLWARIGWRIYWRTLVPQTHIPLIDLLKHYHNQLTLAVRLSPIPLHVLINEGPIHSQPKPTPQLQWDQRQLTHICSEKRRRRLVFLNQDHRSNQNDQAGSDFSSTMIVLAMMGITILLIRWKKDDDLSLTVRKWNPLGSSAI